MSITAPPAGGYDSRVVALRDHLAAHNGIVGLEVLGPDEIERAVRLFHRDGLVVVRDALDADQLQLLRAGVAEVQRLTRYVVADSADVLETGYTMSPPH